MATIFSVELRDDQVERLRELAVEAGVSPEELLGIGVCEWLDGRGTDFVEAAAHVFRKNAELYRRLV
jgi:hypothetical protein